jgi:hypothetical protein
MTFRLPVPPSRRRTHTEVGFNQIIATASVLHEGNDRTMLGVTDNGPGRGFCRVARAIYVDWSAISQEWTGVPPAQETEEL